MTNKEKLPLIFNYLDEVVPDAKCALIYHRDYELLFAVMLSAQTTDNSVNRVTEILFKRFSSLNSYRDCDVNEIELIIHSIGLSKTKARNIKLVANRLINDFHCVVPSKKEDLISLPGVGIKTANVVRAELFHIPEIAVDTHVARISKRLGLVSKSDDVKMVEKKLRDLLPEERYIKTHHQLIMFGRTCCKAKIPQCNCCKLSAICHK